MSANNNERHVDPSNGLTTKQERAIIALLSEPTIAKAADAAQVAQRTLNRWLELPAFNAGYMRARRAAFSQAIALTQRYAPLAVNTLAQMMADKGTSTSARVAAAVAVLRFGREGIELEDLEARVAALEGRGTTAPAPRLALAQ